MGSTLVYRGCRESLQDVQTPMIHRMRCTLFYKGCGESLEGVLPGMIHRMWSSAVNP